ncbi:MAG: chemotaxis protein CheX [Candidatus Didemnitutus sp.]|nr:chemotaxis protein CheX [Candidatus Didemnitutus sp.]
MSATQQITSKLIQETIVRAVQNVSNTLLHCPAQLIAPLEPDIPAYSAEPYHVIGNVGFVGDANGIIYLCMTAEFARFAVGQILGLSPAEVDLHGPDVLQDAIGEMTNITVGGFKNEICDLGYPCRLTLPTIVLGTGLTVASIKGATRHRFSFRCREHHFVADLQLKAD